MGIGRAQRLPEAAEDPPLRSRGDGRSKGSNVKICAIVYSPIRLFADGVAQCLADNHDRDVVACWSIEQLGTLLEHSRADVLLFDVNDESALAAARSVIVAFPELAVVALALPEVLDRVIACADLGFVSYVPRNATLAELGEIVDRALRHGEWQSAAFMECPDQCSDRDQMTKQSHAVGCSGRRRRASLV